MCDRLRYNLQRSKGYLHPDALEVSQLLAALYATGTADPKTRRPDKAMGVYEDVLRQIDLAVSVPKGDRKSGMFRKSVGYKPVGVGADTKVMAAVVREQFELLRGAHGRLGGWTKPVKEFADLHSRLVERLGKDKVAVASPETWKGGEKEVGGGLGMYVTPREWRLESGEVNEKVNRAGEGWVCGVGHNGTVSASVKV